VLTRGAEILLKRFFAPDQYLVCNQISDDEQASSYERQARQAESV
jgi:hypothetical protein